MSWMSQTIAVLLGCCLAAAHSAAATHLSYSPLPGASAEPLPARWPTTATELESFMDSVIARQLELAPAPGATVAVVSRGDILLAKGYGYADAQNKVPVDAERTLFRVGSTSKLFAWTAVMQLVEQGKLDLDSDVNRYLEAFKIPSTYARPVTLRNLMTHSAGFEDGVLGYLLVGSPDRLEPMDHWLSVHMPARVRPPADDFAAGTDVAYSNWGAVLAGYIAATQAGLSFDDYVERHIFTPLGMTRSTFREPLPPQLQADVAAGHVFTDGKFLRQGFEYLHNEAPAGSLSSTATDMARFALALLGDGATMQGRILQPGTTQTMLTRSLSPGPALNGMTLGFFETHINGRRIVGHGGDTVYFHTMLTLLPQEGVGLFVSFNSAEASGAAEAVERAFIEHYFPAKVPQAAPFRHAQPGPQPYAGRYRSLRRSHTKIDKLLALQGEFEVSSPQQGVLEFEHPLAGAGSSNRWIEVEQGVFRQADAATFVAFKQDRDGKVYAVGPDPSTPFERIGWYEQASFHGLLLVIAGLLFVSMIISTAYHGRRDRTTADPLRWARPAMALAGALLIVFLLLFFFAISAGSEELVFEFPSKKLVAALTLPLIAIPLTAIALVFAFHLWSRRAWSWLGRLHYTAAVLGALAFLSVLHYWKLLGYRFG